MVQAEKIRAHREELGLSVKEMSDAIGLGKEGDKLWRKWEAGDEKLPKSQYEKIMYAQKQRRTEHFLCS